MMMFDRIRSAARRHIAYRRTVAALLDMPLETALDLDLYHGDAARIARRAVYGA